VEQEYAVGEENTTFKCGRGAEKKRRLKLGQGREKQSSGQGVGLTGDQGKRKTCGVYSGKGNEPSPTLHMGRLVIYPLASHKKKPGRPEGLFILQKEQQTPVGPKAAIPHKHEKK